jgi:hypothetical protein
LGLRPGATRAEVDLAYRKLIKIHHPDRTGGNGSRAADINRAYTLLRNQGLAVGPQARWVPARVRPAPRRRPARAAWFVAGTIIAATIAGLATAGERGWFEPRQLEVRWPMDPIPAAAQELPLTNFDEPLHVSVIDGAVASAMKFHAAKDIAAAADFSRDCQNRLRRKRNLVWLDACSAFDEATLTLGGEDALANSKDFSDPAVIARGMAAARTISNDVIAADARLHRIRSRVELLLLPMMDAAAAPAAQSAASAGAGEAVQPSGF